MTVSLIHVVSDTILHFEQVYTSFILLSICSISETDSFSQWKWTQWLFLHNTALVLQLLLHLTHFSFCSFSWVSVTCWFCLVFFFMSFNKVSSCWMSTDNPFTVVFFMISCKFLISLCMKLTAPLPFTNIEHFVIYRLTFRIKVSNFKRLLSHVTKPITRIIFHNFLKCSCTTHVVWFTSMCK